MNKTIIEGTLRQLKGHMSASWAALIGNDRLRVRAEEDQMVGELQRRYGRLQEDAQRLLHRWSERPVHSGTWVDWHHRNTES